MNDECAEVADLLALLVRTQAELEAARAVVEVARMAEREMTRLLNDYHAPAYLGVDLIRQMQPALHQNLTAYDAAMKGTK